ncbi:hypothetical protein RV08_GL001940 [Enterococcus mundtii]|uniref:Uncharacterized protein n=1 Tax=Enterococcus mundtii TaxID=53346 RepID=A0ABQ0VBM6_ENTMU|nr:hypothetical protein RV08_GL001940 [Enterococcus mundtii]GEL79839.1 hypothetical protein EMU01_09830 [Enterococcus mundtii]GEN17413.1 hypothetical protein LAC02_06940 [Ligilactobacillus acidipiscis]
MFGNWLFNVKVFRKIATSKYNGILFCLRLSLSFFNKLFDDNELGGEKMEEYFSIIPE